MKPKVYETLKLFCAKKDVREYLNNVNYTQTDTGAYLWASNGAVMAIIKSSRNIFMDNGSYVVNKSETMNPPQSGNLIPGLRLPDIKRSVPRAVKCTEIPYYNPEYVGLFARAAKLLGRTSQDVQIHYNNQPGPTPVTIEKYPEFLGLLMPYNETYDQPGYDYPTWLV